MEQDKPASPQTRNNEHDSPAPATTDTSAGIQQTGESGGPKGPEPTRYGDWERRGRCIDF